MIAHKIEGIGSCPARGFSQEKPSEKLDLKGSERPILSITIGYPGEEDRTGGENGEIFKKSANKPQVVYYFICC